MTRGRLSRWGSIVCLSNSLFAARRPINAVPGQQAGALASPNFSQWLKPRAWTLVRQLTLVLPLLLPTSNSSDGQLLDPPGSAPGEIETATGDCPSWRRWPLSHFHMVVRMLNPTSPPPQFASPGRATGRVHFFFPISTITTPHLSLPHCPQQQTSQSHATDLFCDTRCVEITSSSPSVGHTLGLPPNKFTTIT